MKGLNLVQRMAPVAVLFAAILPGFVPGALAAGPPTVKITVTGTPTPGATVTAKAAVTINDGSALQSLSWKQTSGVTVTASNANTDTITVTLPNRKAFRDQLITVLEEPAVADSALPAYVPTRAATYYGGLQERFQVVGVSNHALADSATIGFNIAVVTTSGTYNVPTTLLATTPWDTSTGQRNVAINVPVVLHAPAPSDPKVTGVYSWTLTAPAGSKTTLVDANAQNPEFTPDVAGSYKLTATNAAGSTPASFTVFAGTWKGVVVGQDVNGRPMTDPNCKSCHVGSTEVFTPWAQSGHAEIVTQNVNDPATTNHYAPTCLECHSVGWSATKLNNNGVTDQADWATASALIPPPGDPLKWTKILAQAPASARLMNIQCENCHGPQNSDAHGQTAARVSLSSDVCGSCHGEPARHGRFQQWQLSGHANFETAISEGTNASCTKCHSAQGFMQWGEKAYASTATINVTWTADDVQPQTCVVCHDPHAEGTTSGDANTNAPMRIMNNTPLLDAGFTATNVGKAAECITCHNGRRGLRDDAHFTAADAARAPHEGPQGDIVLGQNLYFAKVGTKGFHGMLADSCITCHMNKSAAPASITMAGQTNHTFFADPGICSQCHSEITAASIQTDVANKLATLKTNMEAAIKASMQAQIRAGNTMDINGTKVKNAADIVAVEFISSHGSQGVNVTLTGGKTVSDNALTAVKVVSPSGTSTALLTVSDPAIGKSGWNYFMIVADKSMGVHNPAFVKAALDVSNYATSAVATALNSSSASTTTPGGTSAAAIGGGLGNGAGAVSCTTKYVYWAEIAGHMPGNSGSQWRTDIITRNLSTNNATLKFVLHQADGTSLNGTGAVVAGGQKAFEDLVATMGGGNNMGSLEVCSDQPLLVNGRIFNQTTGGTFGQNLDGAVADVGYTTGQTVNLIGLRQKSDSYRTNISVTNSGTTDAQVSITLFDGTGTSIKTYTLAVPAGQVLQDAEPFKNRANVPDLDWGFATVTVVKGSNIHTSASLVDNKTNDPTTITAKQ